MNKKLSTEIIEQLRKIITNPVCELDFSNNFELLCAVMLSAQTTDKRVNSVTQILFKKYPTIKDLSKANINDIQNIIRPIGTFHKKSQNLIETAKKLDQDYNGKLPNNREYLESLPGVGRKTANVVLSNIFNIPCIAVDTHVSRVSKRLNLAKENDNPFQIENKLTKKFKKEDLCKRHHQLVLFGRYHCLARNPKCENCELKEICKFYKNG